MPSPNPLHQQIHAQQKLQYLPQIRQSYSTLHQPLMESNLHQFYMWILWCTHQPHKPKRATAYTTEVLGSQHKTSIDDDNHERRCCHSSSHPPGGKLYRQLQHRVEKDNTEKSFGKSRFVREPFVSSADVAAPLAQGNGFKFRVNSVDLGEKEAFSKIGFAAPTCFRKDPIFKIADLFADVRSAHAHTHILAPYQEGLRKSNNQWKIYQQACIDSEMCITTETGCNIQSGESCLNQTCIGKYLT